MDCEQVKLMVNPYIEGTLTDRECLDFLRHVKDCKNCYEELETYFIVDYALQYLDDEETSRSFDMQKVLQDDIRTNEKRIWRTRLTRAVTIAGMITSEIILLVTAIIKFHPSVARTITEHISVLFPG